MITDFAASLKFRPQACWSFLSRTELKELLPLTNDPKIDIRDTDCEPWLKGYAVGSLFKEWINDSLDGFIDRVPKNITIVRLVDRENKIHAWGSIYTRSYDSLESEVGIYVSPIHRRKGLGTRIIAELKRTPHVMKESHINVHPWNNVGREFFANVMP